MEGGAGVDGRGVARGVSLRLLVGRDDKGGKVQLPVGSKPRGQLSVIKPIESNHLLDARHHS
jgi:hypothetical protein